MDTIVYDELTGFRSQSMQVTPSFGIKIPITQGGTINNLTVNGGLTPTASPYAGYVIKSITTLGADRIVAPKIWPLANCRKRIDVCGASVRANTATAGASTTITLDAGASAVNDFYNGNIIILKTLTGLGQVRVITDYVGSTKVATVDSAWTTIPANLTTFEIFVNVALNVSGGYSVQDNINPDLYPTINIIASLEKQTGATVTPSMGVPIVTSIDSQASIIGSAIFTANEDFTVPTGVTKVYLTGTAAGNTGGNGGTGGPNANPWYGGAGGIGGAGGAGINDFPKTVTPGQVISITVGAGNLVVDGQTWVKGGGLGGYAGGAGAYSITSGTWGVGGSGGVGSAGTAGSNLGGGGGGGAGGGSVFSPAGGCGGNGGDGGVGIGSSGAASLVYGAGGGGGGGGAVASLSGGAGGAAGDGCLIVRW